MKPITRSTIYLPMAAMILMAALAIPAAAQAQTQVSFKGTFEGDDTVVSPTITTSGTGTGTLFGQLSFTNVVTLTSASGGSGTGHWVAGNGDSLNSRFVASAIPGDILYTVTEVHTITTGTGRFAGAQGSFTVLRWHVVAPGSNGTHFIWGSFQGTITPPSAAH